MCDNSALAVAGLMLPPAASVIFYSNLKWAMGSAAPSVGFAPIPSSVKNVKKGEIETWMRSFGSLAETESVSSFVLKALDGMYSCEVNRLKVVIKDTREGVEPRELSIILKKPKETLFHKVMFQMLGESWRRVGGVGRKGRGSCYSAFATFCAASFSMEMCHVPIPTS